MVMKLVRLIRKLKMLVRKLRNLVKMLVKKWTLPRQQMIGSSDDDVEQAEKFCSCSGWERVGL